MAEKLVLVMAGKVTLFSLRSSEDREGDSCCYAHIERLYGVRVGGVGRYEERPGEQLSYLLAYAVAFVAHHDKTCVRQTLGIDIFAFEQSTIDGQ